MSKKLLITCFFNVVRCKGYFCHVLESMQIQARPFIGVRCVIELGSKILGPNFTIIIK